MWGFVANANLEGQSRLSYRVGEAGVTGIGCDQPRKKDVTEQGDKILMEVGSYVSKEVKENGF